MTKKKGKHIKAKIIKDPKVRGEWVESVFMERAGAKGLAVSKPWGDSKSFDFVVGPSGGFVSVQVKSTTVEMGGGYMCTVKKNNQRYKKGSFDFLAAYVIPEDVWYIVPEEKFAGRVTLILCSDSGEAKYEEYREAWDLLRKRVTDQAEEPIVERAVESSVGPPGNAIERVQAAMNFSRRQLEGGLEHPGKRSDEV